MYTLSVCPRIQSSMDNVPLTFCSCYNSYPSTFTTSPSPSPNCYAHLTNNDHQIQIPSVCQFAVGRGRLDLNKRK